MPVAGASGQGGTCYALGPSGRGGPTPWPGPPDRAASGRGWCFQHGRPYAVVGPSGRGGPTPLLGPPVGAVIRRGAVWAGVGHDGPSGGPHASMGRLRRRPCRTRRARLVLRRAHSGAVGVYAVGPLTSPTGPTGPSARGSGASPTTYVPYGVYVGHDRPYGVPSLREGVYAVGPGPVGTVRPLRGRCSAYGGPQESKLSWGVYAVGPGPKVRTYRTLPLT